MDIQQMMKQAQLMQDRLQRDQLINYIPGEVSLVDKGYLAQ